MKSAFTIRNYSAGIGLLLLTMSLLILPGCGAASGKNTLAALFLAGSGSKNGTAHITAAEGGVVRLNDEVTLTIPPDSLPSDTTISIRRVTSIPQGEADGLSAFGQAYRFLPKGTEFDLASPAVLEMRYDETAMAQKGLSPRTTQICYFDEEQQCYVPVNCFVDTEKKTITAYIEHFTIYLPMAQALLATNNAPTVAIQNPVPNPIRANAPIYVRATVTDYDGSIAGVTLQYRKLQPAAGAWQEARMVREVNPQATLHTYGYLIPSAFLTAADLGTNNDIEYRVTATDNLGVSRTSAMRRYNVTRTYQSGSLTFNPATAEIASGFERYFVLRGVDSSGTTFNVVPENFSLDDGSGTLLNRFAQGILYRAATVTPSGSPDYLTAGFAAESASASINVRSGEIDTLEILDTNGLPISGVLAVTEGNTYAFDVVGRDSYGNTIPVLPDWAADSGIGVISTNGELNTTGCHGPGVVTTSLMYASDTQNVVVQSHEREITAFSINGVDGVVAYPFVTVTLPWGTNVTALVANFTITGVSVTANSEVQQSGVSANNFTNPVVYTVAAEDGSPQDYTVTVVIAPKICVDQDGDGFGENCDLGPDCNDNNPNVNPNATEICDNIDNNCDGVIDNVTRSCYTGPAGTLNEGLCHSGSQTCTAGAWGACYGQVLPTVEICDGHDNDCDGNVDENLTRACYEGPAGTLNVGQCHAGSQTCGAGEWGVCFGQVVPSEEICGDSLDNDCDSTIDEICL